MGFSMKLLLEIRGVSVGVLGCQEGILGSNVWLECHVKEKHKCKELASSCPVIICFMYIQIVLLVHSL